MPAAGARARPPGSSSPASRSPSPSGRHRAHSQNSDGEAISYLPPEGLYAMREQIALRGRKHGFASEPEEIVVTSGGLQAIDLTARAVLEPGDVAVIESPTFVGLLSALRATGARVIGVPVDEDGLHVDALERLLARHEVKLVALQTASQNPTGRDLSEERRRRLAELAVERSSSRRNSTKASAGWRARSARFADARGSRSPSRSPSLPWCRAPG